MGFLSHRRRDIDVNPEQKWDFISLNDFKSTSCFTPFAYAFLWFGFFISLAVYVVDIFTAYQLLAFNKWSSQIEPAQFIPFDISKWIFTVCIILSFVNLAYESFRALAIMRRGSVAECFLDSLAARIECFRMGSGRGWRRFLVFAELTKSKKGAEYIALFTFFSFQCKIVRDKTWFSLLTLNQHGSVLSSVLALAKSSTPSLSTPFTMRNCRSTRPTSSPRSPASLKRSGLLRPKSPSRPLFYPACSSPSSFGSFPSCLCFWRLSSLSSSCGAISHAKTVA